MSTKDKRISFEEKGKYPFFTPEGYFDDLTARIMKQIPEADTAISSSKVIGINGTRNTESAEHKIHASHTLMLKNGNLWKNITSIAASLILIAMVAAKLIATPDAPKQENQENTHYVSTEEYNEDLMNYAMTDNMDVYCYLSGGE